MKTLAAQIEHEVAGFGHYVAYEDELQRIWPLDEKDRKAKIAQFAREYGFCLAFYKEGRCAIFKKESSPGLRSPISGQIGTNTKKRDGRIAEIR